MLFLNMNEAAGWYSYIEKKDNKKMAIDGYMGGIGNSFAIISKKEKKINKQKNYAYWVGSMLSIKLSSFWRRALLLTAVSGLPQPLLAWRRGMANLSSFQKLVWRGRAAHGAQTLLGTGDPTDLCQEKMSKNCKEEKGSLRHYG